MRPRLAILGPMCGGGHRVAGERRGAGEQCALGSRLTVYMHTLNRYRRADRCNRWASEIRTILCRYTGGTVYSELCTHDFGVISSFESNHQNHYLWGLGRTHKLSLAETLSHPAP